MRHLELASIALVASVSLAPRDVHASACCMSATSIGPGRLLVWEDAAGGVRLGQSWVWGVWSQDATLNRGSSGFGESVSVIEAWSIIRIGERVQVQGSVPSIVDERWSRPRGQHQVAGGLGDIGAAARLEILSVGEYRGLPALAVSVGALAPTGRRIEQTEPPLFAGATGRGAWAGSLALETEYTSLPWFVRLDAGITSFLPFERSDTHQSQRYGTLLQAGLAAGRELAPDRLVGTIALQGEHQRALQLDGIAVPRSQAYLLTFLASLAWRFDPHWTLVGTFTSSTWPDGLGRNRDARTALNLGLRYGHF